MAKKEKDKELEIPEKENDKKSSPDNSESIIPDEILEAIPEEDRGRVASIIQQTMISGVMRRSNPIAEKITPEHITDIIDKSDKQDIRDREDRKSDKRYNLTLIILGLIFIGFLIVFLQSNEELLIKIIIGIVSFLGGFGFGRSGKLKGDD
jgi:hypothetical protein